MNQQAAAVQWANVNGLRMAYRLEGRPDLPVLVLAHSLMADMSMWDANVPALLERRRVLRYDMRGHGDTSFTTGAYSMSMLADDALALMDVLEIAKADFVGISLGGMVAFDLACHWPQRLNSICICDSGASLPEAMRGDWKARGELAASGVEPLIPATMERWFTPGFTVRNPDLAAKVHAMLARTSPEGYAGCAFAISEIDYTAALPRITLPTLVINGVQDPAWTVGNAEYLRDVIPGARLALIDNAAHIPNIERPEEFNRVLGTFLDALTFSR